MPSFRPVMPEQAGRVATGSTPARVRPRISWSNYRKIFFPRNSHNSGRQGAAVPAATPRGKLIWFSFDSIWSGLSMNLTGGEVPPPFVRYADDTYIGQIVTQISLLP